MGAKFYDTLIVRCYSITGMSDTTTIEIRRETWQELNRRKRGPGDTFDDVVSRLLAAANDEEVD